MLVLMAGCLCAQENPIAAFGTSVASSAGLQGDLYLVKPDQEDLPNFKRMRPIGAIYTTSLQIFPRSFEHGFPGITDRFEWFAIDYNGRFWVEHPGVYRFRLLSDDGSKLYINGKLLVDNDGLHAPEAVDGSAHFSRGVFNIRVSYFQGPRAQVALVLNVISPKEETWKPFDTNAFQPPAEASEWLPGKLSGVKKGSNY
jgi:hypothetical protein